MNPILVCDAWLARRLGAFAPIKDIPSLFEVADKCTNGELIGVLTGEGILVWPFVGDDVKDLNRRTTA